LLLAKTRTIATGTTKNYGFIVVAKQHKVILLFPEFWSSVCFTRAGSQLRRQIINAPNKRRGKINGYSKNAGVSQAKKAAVYIAGAWL
jgi:hypothetical protein